MLPTSLSTSRPHQWLPRIITLTCICINANSNCKAHLVGLSGSFPLAPAPHAKDPGPTHLAGLRGCSPPAISISSGVQCPPINRGSVHSRKATRGRRPAPAAAAVASAHSAARARAAAMRARWCSTCKKMEREAAEHVQRWSALQGTREGSDGVATAVHQMQKGVGAQGAACVAQSVGSPWYQRHAPRTVF